MKSTIFPKTNMPIPAERYHGLSTKIGEIPFGILLDFLCPTPYNDIAFTECFV